MNSIDVAAEFAANVSAVTSQDGLYAALLQACETIGVRYFALSHHVDFAASAEGLRLHNYPRGWQDWYDTNHGSLSDPIHRASHQTATGFYWADLGSLIPLTKADRRLLACGSDVGLGDGVTIPAHVPGEARGSCTFVAERGMPLPQGALVLAQTLGLFAFEAARNIHRRGRNAPLPQASERQRECIVLAGRGMSNHRIAAKLGIGKQSVMEHLREARARFGVTTRTELMVILLLAGQICLDDVRPRFVC